ncbi:MAG: histidine kinase [Bacteroidota bacterium]
MFDHWLTAKRSRWQRHLLFWIFVHIVHGWTYYVAGHFDRFWYDAALLAPFDTIVAYASAYWLLPRYLLRRKYLQFLLGFVSILLLFNVATRFVRVEFIYADYAGPFWDLTNMIYYTILAYAFVFLMMGGVLFKRWFIDERQRQELLAQNLKSELALLRSQVNPHFLFNTLNNIDALIFQNPTAASESIERLSEIMRYMLYEANTESVPVEKEISYLKGMVALIQLRLRDAQAIEFCCSGQTEGKNLPPMLLVPLVENAYKHGLKKGELPLIRIHLDLTETTCRFTVENRLDEQGASRKDGIGGIGLANLRRRLDLIFDDGYQMDIEVEKNIFRVSILFPWLTLADQKKQLV